jgi:uncharacterized protein DUF4388
MKVLIIAGPYEADRVRRAVVSAGFEAVAVEPGESLSGWITASRPDLIVLAPQIVNADPAAALAKVRAVPRGRVPTFLVGDAVDEARLKDLADGFLARPLSTTDLVARVRARLGATSSSGSGSGERRLPTGEQGIPAPMTDGGSGDFLRAGTSKSGLPGASGGASGAGPSTGARTPTSSPGAKLLPTLKPLVSAADAAGAAPVTRARVSEAGAMFMKLAESIDASMDAEMLDVARAVGALRREVPAAPPPTSGPRTGARRAPDDLFERTPMAPMTALAAAAALGGAGESTALSHPSPFDADDEPRDESRQKTLEVPRDVFAKMIAERIAAARDGGAEAGAPAPVERGKLADGDVAAQLARLYLQRLTGRLVLRRDAVEKVIFFDRGAPILGMSSDPDDRMGEMLVRQGRLTAAQLEQASEGLPRAERRLGVVLVEQGFIKPTELSIVVRRHFEEIIQSAFAWEDGEWSLGPGQPTQEIVLLDEHPAAIILAGIRRKYGAARLARCLGGGAQLLRLAAGRFPAGDGGLDLLSLMAVTPEERTIAELFDGARTLDEVRALSGARDEVVGGIAWALSVLGQLDRVTPGNVAVSAALGTNGAGRHAAAGDRERVLGRYALVEEGDYFQVLDLPRGASLDDVRRAHARLMGELAPTSLDAGLVAELGAELRAIRAVLDEALRVLGEAGMRRRYETHLPAAAEPVAAQG